MDNSLITQEIVELISKTPETKQAEINETINKMFTAFAEMKKKVVNIDVISHNDKLNMSIADSFRKAAKKERLLGEEFFEAKRKEVQIQKAAFDLEDKLWLKTSQIFVLLAKDVEKLAEYKAKTAERYVEHERNLLIENRALQEKYEVFFNEGFSTLLKNLDFL